MDSDSIVLELIEQLLRDKYIGFIFYCHNLGGFDAIFLITTIFRYNENSPNESQYKVKCTFNHNKIIKIVISKTNKNKIINTLQIQDSICILNNKL